jgi:hypothetical protein
MMKNKIFQVLCRRSVVLICAVAISFGLASCLDDDGKDVQPTPVGYVSIYHASPDAPGLDVLVDGRRINSQPFDYADHTGYLNFYTGNRNIKLNSANAANALVDTTLSVADGKAYSLFVINRLSGIETLIVEDSSAALPAEDKAMVRFVHLSPDAEAMDVKVNDESTSLFSQTGFRQATDFKEVDAKDYTFKVQGSGADLSTNTITLREGGYYTLVVRGFSNPPDGNTNVLSLEIL